MSDKGTSKLFPLIEEHDAVDALSAICQSCGLPELGRLQQCNGYLRRVLRERINHVWQELCERTWADKLHVVPEARELRVSGNPRGALRLSLAEAARTRLTEKELTGTEWRFRFKAQAGEHWQRFDPYWSKGEAMRVRFEAMPVAGSGQGRVVRVKNGEAVEDFGLRWRWGECGGHRTVQAVINGSRVPQYHISRHPRNWGWIMQSCWVVYMSFEMPRPGVEPALDDDGLVVDVDSQRHEAAQYNMGVGDEDIEEEAGFEHSDSDEDDEDDTTGALLPEHYNDEEEDDNNEEEDG